MKVRPAKERATDHDAWLAGRRAELGTIGPQLVDNETALWILDNVLPATERAHPGLPCSCLLGLCGPCGRGECRRGREHDDCLNIRRPAAFYGGPEGHLLNRAGFVRGPAVWLADRTCRYRCPCTCWTEPPANPLPERPPAVPASSRPEQLDLFGAVA